MTRGSRRLLALLGAMAFGGAFVSLAARPEARASQVGPASASAEGGVEVLQLRQNFFLIAGAGGHVGVQIGNDGVVLVDAGSAALAGAALAAIRGITSKPIRYVINTSADQDHVGGNETLAKAGQTLFTNAGSAALPGNYIGGAASILAAENVLARMSAPTGQSAPFPAAAWPTETFDQPRKYMYLNSEGIEIFHQKSAHTDGDAIVFFRRSDVVVAGDVFDTTHFPVIDVARGGSITGEIAALNKIVELAIPSVPIVSREEGTLVVPGHGRVCDQIDVIEYRDMVTIVRDRVRDLMGAGMTLAQIQTASPARGYTRRYAASAGPASAAGFVESVYQSLAKEKK